MAYYVHTKNITIYKIFRPLIKIIKGSIYVMLPNII